jgi:hypothetical protein
MNVLWGNPRNEAEVWVQGSLARPMPTGDAAWV